MNKRRITLNVGANIQGRHYPEGSFTERTEHVVPRLNFTPKPPKKKKLKETINYQDLLEERCKKLQVSAEFVGMHKN